MALPKRLKDFDIYIDGVSYMGRATEVTLPKLSRKMEEYTAAGVGPVELDQGMEKLEAEITLSEYATDALKLFAQNGVDAVRLHFRGAALSDEASSQFDAIEVIMGGRFKEMDFGSAKKGEETTLKLSAALSYYKYVVNGERIMEFDVVNRIEYMGGEDRMGPIREALGML